jgi:hypothetical protein
LAYLAIKLNSEAELLSSLGKFYFPLLNFGKISVKEHFCHHFRFCVAKDGSRKRGLALAENSTPRTRLSTLDQLRTTAAATTAAKTTAATKHPHDATTISSVSTSTALQ